MIEAIRLLIVAIALFYLGYLLGSHNEKARIKRWLEHKKSEGLAILNTPKAAPQVYKPNNPSN